MIYIPTFPLMKDQSNSCLVYKYIVAYSLQYSIPPAMERNILDNTPSRVVQWSHGGKRHEYWLGFPICTNCGWELEFMAVLNANCFNTALVCQVINDGVITDCSISIV